MKKPVRDLTLGEVQGICVGAPSCEACPLYRICRKEKAWKDMPEEWSLRGAVEL